MLLLKINEKTILLKPFASIGAFLPILLAISSSGRGEVRCGSSLESLSLGDRVGVARLEALRNGVNAKVFRTRTAKITVDHFSREGTVVPR